MVSNIKPRPELEQRVRDAVDAGRVLPAWALADPITGELDIYDDGKTYVAYGDAHVHAMMACANEGRPDPCNAVRVAVVLLDPDTTPPSPERLAEIVEEGRADR